MTPPVLRRVVSALLFGAGWVPMTLEYLAADPLAVALTLGTSSHRRTWYVARDLIAAGLGSDQQVGDYTGEWAGDVLLSRLPGAAVLMGLRSRPDRLLMIVAAAEFGDFLASTYEACPLQREARLVTKELDMQIGFFQMTDGGGNPA